MHHHLNFWSFVSYDSNGVISTARSSRVAGIRAEKMLTQTSEIFISLSGVEMFTENTPRMFTANANVNMNCLPVKFAFNLEFRMLITDCPWKGCENVAPPTSVASYLALYDKFMQICAAICSGENIEKNCCFSVSVIQYPLI